MLMAAVRGNDETRETDLITLADGVTADRRATGAIEGGKECAFAGDRVEGRRIVDRRQQFVDPVVADTALDTDRALCGCRREAIGVEDIGDHLDLAKTLEARKRQKRRVDLTFLQLAQARVHKAAESDDVDIRPHAANERLTAKRG